MSAFGSDAICAASSTEPWNTSQFAGSPAKLRTRFVVATESGS